MGSLFLNWKKKDDKGTNMGSAWGGEEKQRSKCKYWTY
jgi:hypothetical protein